MKKNHLRIMVALVLLLSVSLLTACGSPAAQEEAEEQKLAAAVEADVLPEIEENVPEAPAEGYAELTLEALLGEDYVEYLTETITMQMENRMEKTPEVVFFPIEEDAPLTDYVTIDASTPFTLDEEDGSITLTFDAGMVTDAENGAQSFRIPLP